MYDFHKSRNAKNQECFNHPFFIKGKKSLLSQIRRKNAVPKDMKDMKDTTMNNLGQLHFGPEGTYAHPGSCS